MLQSTLFLNLKAEKILLGQRLYPLTHALHGSKDNSNKSTLLKEYSLVKVVKCLYTIIVLTVSHKHGYVVVLCGMNISTMNSCMNRYCQILFKLLYGKIIGDVERAAEMGGNWCILLWSPLYGRPHCQSVSDITFIIQN